MIMRCQMNKLTTRDKNVEYVARDYITSSINNMDQKILNQIISRHKLEAITILISKGTHPEVAFRTEGETYVYRAITSFANSFPQLPDNACTELIILRLCERLWYKSIANITVNLYNIATSSDAKNAIVASKLLLDYNDNLEERVNKYKLIYNARR